MLLSKPRRFDVSVDSLTLAVQKPVLRIRQVAPDLAHPQPGRYFTDLGILLCYLCHGVNPLKILRSLSTLQM